MCYISHQSKIKLARFSSIAVRNPEETSFRNRSQISQPSLQEGRLNNHVSYHGGEGRRPGVG